MFRGFKVLQARIRAGVPYLHQLVEASGLGFLDPLRAPGTMRLATLRALQGSGVQTHVSSRGLGYSDPIAALEG